ncbi:MFS transporter, partial [Streptomyces sp. WAC08241]|uniref:MFS transporter n=1 Tax=Streptomyces sp. WAC08241 TaxID=2487421 RepID=UPI000F99DA44
AHTPYPEVPPPRRWWGLVVLALAQLVVLFDAAFSYKAMVWSGAGDDLGISREGVRVSSTVYLDVVPIAYTLAFVVLLPFGSRLARLLGGKRLLVAGLAGFAAATALSALAPSSDVWTTGRALQGAFAALVSSSAPVLVSASFPDPRERRRAFGTHLAIAGGAPALGLTVFWLLPIHPYWRWILFAEVLLAVVALVGAAVLVRGRPGRTAVRPDGLGVLCGALGIAAISGAVPHFTGNEVLLPAAGVLVAAFVWRRTGTSGAPGPSSGGGGRAHAGFFVAAALANVVAALLYTALGYSS